MKDKFNHEVPEKLRKITKLNFVCSIIVAIFLVICAGFVDGGQDILAISLLFSAIMFVLSGYVLKLLLYGFAILVDNSMNAEERAQHEAEERAQHEAEERIKRENEEQITNDNNFENIKISQNEKELAKKLAYALQYPTDEGMINYLNSYGGKGVSKILKVPKNLIRNLIKEILADGIMQEEAIANKVAMYESGAYSVSQEECHDIEKASELLQDNSHKRNEPDIIVLVIALVIIILCVIFLF